MPRSRMRLLLPAVAIALFGLTAVPSANATTSDGAKYVGTWNYDQPDNATMRNVAVLDAGSPIRFPQIGNIVFAENSSGGITGHTDQGCSWEFQVQPHSLELTSPQTCFNHVINSAYTITRWSVSVSGRHEKESFDAISHQPTGDVAFTLGNGARTKVRIGARSHATRRFTGPWTYDPANPQTLVNMVTTVAPDGTVTAAAQTGTVDFGRKNDHTITARTANGCRWTLNVQGNTAELLPAAQTCVLATSTETLSFWSIASNGRHQASIMTGTDTHAGEVSPFALSIGSLTRH
jgi:hypothetical protein